MEQIPPSKAAEPRKTRTIRAKAAGTNPKYIDLTDKLYDEDPLPLDPRMGDRPVAGLWRNRRVRERPGLWWNDQHAQGQAPKSRTRWLTGT